MLTKTQQLLVDLAHQNGGIFYPHYQMWHEKNGTYIYIGGAGYASSIRSLIKKNIVRPLPDLHPYAFEIITHTTTGSK